MTLKESILPVLHYYLVLVGREPGSGDLLGSSVGSRHFV